MICVGYFRLFPIGGKLHRNTSAARSALGRKAHSLDARICIHFKTALAQCLFDYRQVLVLGEPVERQP
jgi:hypothetical protein